MELTHMTDRSRIPIPRLILTAPGTGQGKTTVAAAVMALLAERGLRVAPFKVGPDYLDPTHHRAAAGRASRNLDSWLLPPDVLLALFRRAATGANAADVAVVEGMMGLFDGRSAASDEGSTAAVAKLLGTPVVLVLDVWTMGRGAAAVVHGMATFDPDLTLAGVVLNRAAARSHVELCRDAIAATTGVPVLGWLPADEGLAVPERHLGLTAAGERAMDLARLRDAARETLDVDALLRIARSAPPLPAGPDPLPAPAAGVRAVIAVARDAAFDFYYEDNLDLLRAAGAELRFFSPLADARIPADADTLYLGGGYPELHAAALAANAEMRADVSRFAASGRPVYAECGGLMYLCDALVDEAGARHPMAGVLPGESRMRGLTIGYREVVALRDTPIARAGWTVRGHEFHHSVLAGGSPSPAYRRKDGTETEGVVGGKMGNVLGSYVHVHFGADARMAERFVARAAAARKTLAAAHAEGADSHPTEVNR
jgi:cobyrinic acid a,c-diamide synthase